MVATRTYCDLTKKNTHMGRINKHMDLTSTNWCKTNEHCDLMIRHWSTAKQPTKGYDLNMKNGELYKHKYSGVTVEPEKHRSFLPSEYGALDHCPTKV